MSSKNRRTSLRLSLAAILVLVICAGSLLVHFVVEGLTFVEAQLGFDLAEHYDCVRLIHTHCEDQFILSFANRPTIEHLPARLEPLSVSRAFSFSISPLLPPPNF